MLKSSVRREATAVNSNNSNNKMIMMEMKGNSLEVDERKKLLDGGNDASECRH